MPKHVIISKLGGPEVLKYKEYSLPDEIKFNDLKKELYSLIQSLGPTDDIEIWAAENHMTILGPTMRLEM